MEEQKPRIQSPPPFHHPLARQPYSENEYDSAPLEEEGNVVPMPIQNTITEDERLPRNASKRKPRSATEGKTQAATGSKKTFKMVRQSQSMPYQYADELKRLEEHAKRINQILAERSNKEAIRETIPTGISDSSPPNLTKHSSPLPEASTQSAQWQVSQRSPHIQPIKNQWQSPTPVEEQNIETLKSQEHSIHQRLVELGLYLNEAGSLIPSSEASSDLEQGNYTHGQSSVPQVPAATSPVSHSPTQAWEGAPSQPWDQPLDTAKVEDFPNWGRGIAANQNSPRDRPRSRFPLPTTLRRYLREWRGGLRDGRSLEVPQQPIDRISDAALWIAVSVVVRVASRYVLTVFPILSPLFLVLMLAPAIVAVYLVCCVPKAGWIPYYRLFLIMVGFLVGGKL